MQFCPLGNDVICRAQCCRVIRASPELYPMNRVMLGLLEILDSGETMGLRLYIKPNAKYQSYSVCGTDRGWDGVIAAASDIIIRDLK